MNIIRIYAIITLALFVTTIVVVMFGGTWLGLITGLSGIFTGIMYVANVEDTISPIGGDPTFW